MDHSRRMFLSQAAGSLGLLYLTGLTPGILAQAHEHAKAAPVNLDGQPFKFLTPQQAADYEAFAAQIIPTDDTPGAREANVVHFVDFALSEIEPQNKQAFVKALAHVNEQAKQAAPQAASFSALAPAQQIEVMKTIEHSEAFGMLRAYTIIGFFGDPSDGGNKDKVGWKLLNFPDDFYYAPPFGYYDAELLKEKGGKA